MTCWKNISTSRLSDITKLMRFFVKNFDRIGIGDVQEVGGKNASLGELYSRLSETGINVPFGFAITANAFRCFLDENGLNEPLQHLMQQLDRNAYSNLRDIGQQARSLLLSATLPDEIIIPIRESYKQFCKGEECFEVAVRSSATAEDLPEASFAGQHESFLNVRGEKALLEAVHKCYASLYTDRAIKYREDNHFLHEKVFMSVGVQRMIRADKGCSGIGFTLEPESGFRDVVHIAGVWGLGENIVQGAITPDEFLVFKPTLRQGKYAIIQKQLGDKKKMLVYGNNDDATQNIEVPVELQRRFVLSDAEITRLAEWSLAIESHYGRPMDIEWAKDGLSNELYIIQARPETVHSTKNPAVIQEYKLLKKGERIIEGMAIGSRVVSGKAKILNSPKEAARLETGDIIVTDITSPDWDPLLKKAAGIVTNKGGRTSHASIVARELDVPAIVGTSDATERIADGDLITISCCEGKTGYVYRGAIDFEVNELDFSRIRLPQHPDPMMILADPDKAFRLSFYPNRGIGLMRMEFTITHAIKVHPMALVKFNELSDEKAKLDIEALTALHPSKRSYFINRLSQGLATVAAAFYPKDVIVRFSDFKTNEYAALLGGQDFEPKEENPMIGFRGASRYYHPLYKEGFGLECTAIKRVREEMGFTNVKVMVPFCRTVEEGRRVLEVMAEFGLERGQNGLEVYVMVEIPSNVLLAMEFAEVFDGFSIGSNDLTQLTLGIDRDSSLVADLFDEENAAVKHLIASVIKEAKHSGIKIGLCGQAPSDIPSFAKFLAEQGIDSISFNPDALMKGIENIGAAAAVDEKTEAAVQPVML
jgi:pyruvate,water dikinase